jgi:hypothetical protein
VPHPWRASCEKDGKHVLDLTTIEHPSAQNDLPERSNPGKSSPI